MNSTQKPDLRTAAQAVIDRWDTPKWKDAPATAEYISALRDALAAERTAAGQEPMFWVRLCSDGLYEGPIHNARIEEVRQRSGVWSPLYLGAALQPAPSTEGEDRG